MGCVTAFREEEQRYLFNGNQLLNLAELAFLDPFHLHDVLDFGIRPSIDDGLSYCQMLCMGLGGDPLFHNPIHKFYPFNNFSEALRVV
jgi:hypothetical protein